MNPYVFTVTCDVCGGEGDATARTNAAAYRTDSFISHRDPRVCADVIARRERVPAESPEERSP